MSSLSFVWRRSASRHRAPAAPIITTEEVHRQLDILCHHKSQGKISDRNVRNIQAYLRVLDDRASRSDDHGWTSRPRIYAILRNIGADALRWMDNFIQHNLTDFNLPFTEQTLPAILGETPTEVEVARNAFFALQGYYLTDKKDIESDVSKHLTLAETGDTWFVPLKPLGQGGFGSVDLVFSRLSTDRFARKRVLRFRGTEQAQQYLIQELRELRRLNHHHLVRIIGSYTDPEYVAYLMKPVAEGTLEDFLSSRTTLRPVEKVLLRRFYGCLSGAMNYLYQNNVRHRDFHGEIYISDFGSSYSWRHKSASKTNHRDVPVSPDYMAPEIATGKERGTQSDMFSLGMVYLEMTTRLLGQRPASLKDEIKKHAHKHKAQPYPFANLGVVIGWMEGLGKLETEHDHDREPLGWIRDLLHEKPEHRLTPPQLMKYILESPSFGVFRCLQCEPAFYNENFATGPVTGVSRIESTLQAQETMHEVRAMLGTLDGDGGETAPISDAKSDFITGWMENTSNSTRPASNPQPSRGRQNHRHHRHEATPWNPDPFRETHADIYEAPSRQQVNSILYSTFEHEFYNPAPQQGLYGGLELPLDPIQEGSTPQMSSVDISELSGEVAPVELPGDMSWYAPEEVPETPSQEPEKLLKPEREEKNLEDSGLGFLEYASDSSVDENHEIQEQPFEEISDCSTVASAKDEECFDDDECASPQTSLTIPGTPSMATSGHDAEAKPDSSLGLRRNSLGFDEEDDVSEPDNLFEEASDRSDAVEVHDAVQQGTAPQNTLVISGDRVVSAMGGDSPDDGVFAGARSPIIIDEQGVVRTPDREEWGAWVLQDTPSPADQGSSNENNSLSTYQSPQVHDDTSEGGLVSPDAVEVQRQPSAGMETVLPLLEPAHMQPTIETTKKPKTPKKATFATEVQYREIPAAEDTSDTGATVGPEVQYQHHDYTAPDDQPHSSASLLSENNLRVLNESSPRSPQKRKPVVPVNVAKLIANTWDMASSAPTSVMSEEAKSKISSFFFLFPTEAQIESFMTEYCKKGSSSATKELLRRGKGSSSKPKPLRPRQYFNGLLAAVKGASGRHNKCVRNLLDAGVDPNHRSKKTGQTPLHIAVEHTNFKGYTKLIWLLLSGKADPNAKDRNGNVPLMKLFVGPDTTPLEAHRRGALIMLLREGASANVFVPGGAGTTPLHQAVRRQDHVSAAVLLHYGANVNAKTLSGTTPLQMCANQFQFSSGGDGGHDLSAGHAAVLDVLLANGAHVDEAAGSSRRTALHWAVMAGSAQAVTRLLAAGASAKVKDKEGYDAVALAIKHAEKLTEGEDDGKLDDHVEIMLSLVKSAECPWASRLEEGKCAVETACIKDEEVLRGLLERKMNAQCSFRGETIERFTDTKGSLLARQLIAGHATAEG